MKTDKEVIAELLTIIRLLIQGNQCASMDDRISALETWRASVEAVWPESKEI